MLVSSRTRPAKIIRVSARVLGLLVTVVYLFVLIVAANLGEQSHAAPEIMGGVLALGAYVISLWRVRLAGILLVLISVGTGVFVGVVSPTELLGWGIVLLPWLITGILFLTSWRLLRSAS